MKKTVFDINDLQKSAPFFKTWVGKPIGKLLLKWLGVANVNKVHENSCHLTGAAFTSSLLKDPLIDINYNVHNKELLSTLPEGAFITVSNHPIGSLDGIMLIDIFASIRPDFKVMVNGILDNIGAMEENFISVKPDTQKTGANLQNMNGVRASLYQLKSGSPMGFFPAGAISFYRKDEKRILDMPWTHSVVRIIKKSNLPVYPVFFDCYNSKFFYWLGNIDWRIRTLRIPAEVFNKKRRTLDVYIGKPIPPEKINEFSDETLLADYLYKCTYGAKKA